MPISTAALVAAHIFCVSLGYGGLIVANLWLAVQPRTLDREGTLAALSSSSRMTRIFGPLLGVGIVLGFGLMAGIGFSALSPWLICSYVFIVLAALLQVFVGIPWQRRTVRAATQGDAITLDRRVPALVSGGFAVAFAVLVLLMAWRPGVL